MSSPLVSVIVPIYNAEKYLEECIESILSQSYENIEVILVDDGSMDASSTICDTYAEQDGRIIVHHKANEGLVRARKTGLSLAHGEYVCFVDADDMIMPEMLSYFVSHIGDADLITSGCQRQLANGERKQEFDALAAGVYTTAQEKKYLLANMFTFEHTFTDGLMPYLWNKMYRASILKEAIQCVDDAIVKWEDRALLYPYVLRCKSVVITKESFYFYRYSANSMIHSASKNVLHNLNLLYASLEKEFLQHEQSKLLIKQLELFTTAKLYLIGTFMKFSNDTKLIQYIFPYTNLLEGKRYVLYGAGRVGMDYYRQIRQSTEGELVLWVDKQSEQFVDSDFDIRQVADLSQMEFDVLLIAVNKENVANVIKNELMQAGIEEEKLWWKPPIRIERV